jgi:hypothetical protein
MQTSDEITFEHAYAGQFLKDYKSDPNNIHSLTNDLFASKVRFSLANIVVPGDAVQFPDVSFWQGEIDWDEFATHTRAVIIRVGQGRFIDPQFERNYAEAVKRGLRVGFYFFYDDRYSPGEQAETLINALHGKIIDMEVFIDWETSYGGGFRGLPNVVSMMEAVEIGIPGVLVGMYTGYYWFRENSNAITHASHYNYLKSRPLWLAWYADDPSFVLVPAPWSSLTHWQFGTPAVSWGQATLELDMNKCMCNVIQFVDRYGGENEEDDGGNMKYKVVWSKGVARRTRPTTSNSYTGLAYSFMQEVDVIQENVPDALDPVNANKMWVQFADGLYGASVYPDSLGIVRVRMEKIAEPDPDPVPGIVHKIDIYSDGKIAVDDGSPF